MTPSPSGRTSTLPVEKEAKNQCIERSRGGPTTKIHALADGLGDPTHLHLTPGNVHDVVEAPALIAAARGDNFIADKGYDSNDVVDAARAKGMKVVIPSRENRKVRRPMDTHLYRERHLIENFFATLKQWRRVATRYEKTARNFLGLVLLASAVVWLA